MLRRISQARHKLIRGEMIEENMAKVAPMQMSDDSSILLPRPKRHRNAYRVAMLLSIGIKLFHAAG